MLGIEPRPQRWEARVLPLCHRGPLLNAKNTHTWVDIVKLRSGKFKVDSYKRIKDEEKYAILIQLSLFVIGSLNWNFNNLIHYYYQLY